MLDEPGAQCEPGKQEAGVLPCLRQTPIQGAARTFLPDTHMLFVV